MFNTKMPPEFYIKQIQETADKLMPPDLKATDPALWSSLQYLQGLANGMWIAGVITIEVRIEQHNAFLTRYNQIVMPTIEALERAG